MSRDKSATAGLQRAAATVGLWTAASRLLGFLRDIVLAFSLGAGPLADAFFVAFKLPNLFRRLTAEGAMTNIFLPGYAATDETEGRQAAMDLAAEIQAGLFWVLLGVVVVMEVFMAGVIGMLAPGFVTTAEAGPQPFIPTAADGDQRLDDAILLARLTIPYLPMISLVALWVAIANTHGRFRAGAAAPILLNCWLIAGGILTAVLLAEDVVETAWPLALSVSLAGICQLLMLGLVLWRLGRFPASHGKGFWRWLWPWPVAANAAKLWRRFVPAALGAGSLQLNLLIDMVLASLLPVGSISVLYFADRIAQLPLGIVGIALGTALLPQLARLEADKSPPERRQKDGMVEAAMAAKASAVAGQLAEAVRLGLLLGLPAALGMILLSPLLVRGLFGYGAFSDAMLEPTALVLAAYGLGVPGFILNKVMLPAFYARGDATRPLRVGLIMVAVNIIGSICLMQLLGVVGLALATSFAAWVSVLILAVLLWRDDRLDSRVFNGMTRLLLAVMILAVLLIAGHIGAGWLPASWPALVPMLLLVGLGLFGYAAATLMLGLLPARWLPRRLRWAARD